MISLAEPTQVGRVVFLFVCLLSVFYKFESVAFGSLGPVVRQKAVTVGAVAGAVYILVDREQTVRGWSRAGTRYSAQRHRLCFY